MNINSVLCSVLMIIAISNLSLPAMAEQELQEDERMAEQEISSSGNLESEFSEVQELSDRTTSEDAIAGTGMEKRIESRQERRTDIAENLNDGSQDRQEFRQGRRDSVGEGSEARVENRQDKRENRRARGDDRRQDRTDRVNDRF